MNYFDRGGRPIGQAEWIEAFESDSRRVAETTTRHGYLISTVWLGLDHSFGRGRPLIFETIVFGPDTRNVDAERYSTLAEAQAGHKEMVERWSTDSSPVDR